MPLVKVPWGAKPPERVQIKQTGGAIPRFERKLIWEIA
jgi:hypothetical protein